jgi:hypothetical protein
MYVGRSAIPLDVVALAGVGAFGSFFLSGKRYLEETEAQSALPQYRYQSSFEIPYVMNNSQSLELPPKLSPITWASIGLLLFAAMYAGKIIMSPALVAVATGGAVGAFFLSGQACLAEVETQWKQELPPAATANLPIAKDEWIGGCMLANGVVGVAGLLTYLGTLSMLGIFDLGYLFGLPISVIFSVRSLSKKRKSASIKLERWRKKVEPPHEANEDFLFWESGDEVEVETRRSGTVKGTFQSFTKKAMIIKVRDEPETLREFNTADLGECSNPRAERRKEESRTKELKKKVGNRYQKKLEAFKELSMEDLKKETKSS